MRVSSFNIINHTDDICAGDTMMNCIPNVAIISKTTQMQGLLLSPY